MSDEFSLGDEYDAYGDDLKGRAFPKGTYEMRVASAVPKTTSTGKQAIVVNLEFTKGPYRGKKVPEQMTWSPENEVAARIFANSLAMMGATTEWIRATKPKMEQICARITGQLVEVDLTEDEWQGQERNRVRFKKNLGKPAGAATPTLGDPTPAAAAAPLLGADEEATVLSDEDPLDAPVDEPVKETVPPSSEEPESGLNWP